MKRVLVFLALIATMASLSAQWSVSDDIDVMTDKRSVTVFGFDGMNALVIRMKNDELSVFVVFNRYFDEGFKTITMRLDKNEPFDWMATVANTSTALFFVDEAEALKQISGSKERIVLRAQPYSGAAETLVIDMAGFAEVIAPYREIFGLQDDDTSSSN